MLLLFQRREIYSLKNILYGTSRQIIVIRHPVFLATVRLIRGQGRLKVRLIRGQGRFSSELRFD